ncbi:MAG: hypothetical protein AAF206_02740 [Bacteroidota bacterium]
MVSRIIASLGLLVLLLLHACGPAASTEENSRHQGESLSLEENLQLFTLDDFFSDNPTLDATVTALYQRLDPASRSAK